MEIDWDIAPADTTHAIKNIELGHIWWYKVEGENTCIWSSFAGSWSSPSQPSWDVIISYFPSSEYRLFERLLEFDATKDLWFIRINSSLDFYLASAWLYNTFAVHYIEPNTTFIFNHVHNPNKVVFEKSQLIAPNRTQIDFKFQPVFTKPDNSKEIVELEAQIEELQAQLDKLKT